MIREFDGIQPEIHPTAYVHETAVVIGRVKLGPKVSVWPHAVLRGDVEEIIVGEGANIQDNTVIHTDHGIPTILGDWISVGHSAVLHGCTIGNHCLIGMGAILLNNSIVEDEATVAAGALLSPNTRIPKAHLAMGMPAKIIRAVKPEEIQKNLRNAEFYVELIKKHQK